jgi:hypothetical protein
MANLCSNTVRIEGLDEDTLEAFTTLMSQDGKFFSFFIPAPDFSHDKTNFELIGWRNANWGSKWDVGEAWVEVEDGVLTASYDTAWAPHVEGYAKVAEMYPDAKFTLWYEEGGMGFRGKMVAQGNEMTDECEDMVDN